MKNKIYTAGQIGKLHKVPLSEVRQWALEIKKILGVQTRSIGIIPIETDTFGRYGFPQSIANLFPQIPDKQTLIKTLKSTDEF